MFNIDVHKQSTTRNARWLCHHDIQIFAAKFATKGGGVYWKDICTSDFDKFMSTLTDKPVNLAIVFGPKSNLIDIEPDSPDAVALMDYLMAETGCRTLSYRSRLGVHRLFRWEPRLAHLGTRKIIMPIKLDIRLGTEDKALYSICPPSIHEDTGLPYEWVPGHAPWECGIANVPDNIIQYILDNAGSSVEKKDSFTLDVEAAEDGYLPTEGGRHQYMLGLSKLLFSDVSLPTRFAKKWVREISQETGAYFLPNRGEHEIDGLFRGLSRKHDPVKEMAAVISMADLSEEANELINRYDVKPKVHVVPDEIPDHIFHPVIQQASLHAKAGGYPRNLWLMNIMAGASFALGNAFKVRYSPNVDPVGVQIYSFGVGGSGKGKSRTMKAILSCFKGQDSVITDATPEALTKNMADSPRGSMLELAEGKEFASMFGRYSENGKGDSSLFHKTWSGDRIRVIRQKGTVWVDSPFLTIAAAIQGSNLAQLPHGDMMDGLLQRMIIFPIGDSAKKWDREALKKHSEFITEWQEIVKRLQSVKAVIGSGAPQVMMTAVTGEPSPQIGTLTPDAEVMYQAYFDFKRSSRVEDEWPEDHPFRADIVRHAEIALRVAGVIFQTDQACNHFTWTQWDIPNQDNVWINADQMKRAIDFTEWSWMQKQIFMEGLVEAAFAAAMAGEGMKKSETVFGKLEKLALERRRRIERANGDSWTLRDYYTTLRMSKVDAQKELDMLIRERHVVPMELKEGQKAVRYEFVHN